MPPPTGYSGKPLSLKLGVKPGDVIRTMNAPAHYVGLLEPLPDGATIVEACENPALVHMHPPHRAAAFKVGDLVRPGASAQAFRGRAPPPAAAARRAPPQEPERSGPNIAAPARPQPSSVVWLLLTLRRPRRADDERGRQG